METQCITIQSKYHISLFLWFFLDFLVAEYLDRNHETGYSFFLSGIICFLPLIQALHAYIILYRFQCMCVCYSFPLKIIRKTFLCFVATNRVFFWH